MSRLQHFFHASPVRRLSGAPFILATFVLPLILPAAAHSDAGVSSSEIETVVHGDMVQLMRDGRPWFPNAVVGGPRAGVTTDGVIEMAVVTDAAFWAIHDTATLATACELTWRAGLVLDRSANTDFRMVVKNILPYEVDPFPIAEVDGEVDPLQLLEDFRDWAAGAGAGALGTWDAAMLLTGRDLTNSTVGLAYVGTVCSSASASIVQAAALPTQVIVDTMNHELGHNLGMCHDDVIFGRGSCADLSGVPDAETVCANHLMKSSIGPDTLPIEEFSVCSAADHENFLSMNSATCLATPVSENPVDCSAVVCPASPRNDCAVAAVNNLKVQSDNVSKKNQLNWKWKKGAEVPPADFGAPASSTEYRLCVYDGLGGVPIGAGLTQVEAGPLWQDKAEKGWQYKNKPKLAPRGVAKVQLRPGIGGSSQIAFKAKGLAFVPPLAAGTAEYFDVSPSVDVQLLSSAGECWGTTFVADDVKKNESTKFVAVKK